jgi:hypothetical protein
MRRLGLLAALVALLVVPASASAKPRVVIALLPAIERTPLPRDASQAVKDARKRQSERESVLTELERREQLAIGFTGATQGAYSQEQALLDLTQGTRVSKAAYDPDEPPELGFVLTEDGHRAWIEGWTEAVRRAQSAPAKIVPGLLAGSIPGGAGFAGFYGQGITDAVVSADRAGQVAEASLGSSATVARRALGLLRDRALVVAALPPGRSGTAQMDLLISRRAPETLLIVMKSPPDRRSPQLLPTGIAGLGDTGTLTSPSTRRRGIVAGIDILPTVLDHLGLPIPSVVRGQAIRVEPGRDVDALRSVEQRLRVISARRMPALRTLVAAWLLLLVVLRLAGGPRGVRAGLRIGGLAVLWVPTLLLATAALHPARIVEVWTIALGCLALGAVSDRLLPWPRGPALPALVGLLAYAVDLARHSELIVQSLLGPNPRFGSRYYGLGNELESTLPLLLLFGLAGLLSRPGGGSDPRTRARAALYATSGAALFVIMGAGRLGADVGAVFTVGAATGVGTLLMLPGGVTPRRVAVALGVPALFLAALAGIDLATGGEGHFTRSVLNGSGSDFLDTVTRRYELALNQLLRGMMVLLALTCVLLIALAVRNRRATYAPVAGSAAWQASLWGALAAGVAGTLFNDSGPLLLVFTTFILVFMTLYVRGDPRLAEAAQAPVGRPRRPHLRRRRARPTATAG